MVNGAVGSVFILLLVQYLTKAETVNPMCASMLVSATALSALTFVRNLPLWATRLAAIFTVAVMFYFFASFFHLVPSLGEQWYQRADSLVALSFLFGAFCMIPLMAEYSCRLKADCPYRRSAGGGRGFFTVPERLQKQIS
ncbi:MAG: hypothetical protein AAF648_04045 [Pseudomonadota bacterium]